MILVAAVALAFWGLHAKKQREIERWRVLDYSRKAEHNRKMAQVALTYVPELERSIACKLGEEVQDPYPTLSAGQCKKMIPSYRALAEYYRRLARTYDHAAAHPWDRHPSNRPNRSSYEGAVAADPVETPGCSDDCR
jgi:hypothetical protein